MSHLRCIVAVAALALTAAPAVAQAAWHPESIPGTAGAQPPTTLAVDRQGRAIALFEGFAQGQPPRRFTGVVLRAPDGTWTRGADLAGIGWGSARVHLYASTRALLIARQVSGYGAYNRARYRLVWALGRSDGTFAAMKTIASSADVPASAVDDAGDAIVAYALQGGDTLRVNERPAGGSFGPAHVISPAGAVHPVAAMNARGDRVVAWFRGDRVEARVRRPGHSWGSVLTAGRLKRSGQDALRATVAANGRIALAWESVDIRESRPVTIESGAAVRAINAGWHSALLERSTLDSQSFAADPVAVPLVDTRGRLWVATTGRWKGGTGVRLAHLSQTARVADTTLLSPENADATLDDAAAGPQDRLAVTWAEHVSAGTVRTAVALRPGDAPFDAPVTLTAAGETGLVDSRVTFSPISGQAIVVRPLVAGGAGALAAAVSDP